MASSGMNSGKSSLERGVRLGLIGRFLGAIGALVGDDQLHVPAPPQRAVTLEAADRGQIVRFLTEAVLVKTSDRRIDHLRRIEAIQRRPARFRDPRRLVFEERLVGRHFAGLRRQRFSVQIFAGIASPAN